MHLCIFFKQHSYTFFQKKCLLYNANGSNLKLVDVFIYKEGESSPNSNFSTILHVQHSLSPISIFQIKLPADVSEKKYSLWVRKLLY